MSVARSVAITGSAQPVSGSNVIVDGEIRQADGVEHEHRPPPPAQRSAQLVEVGAGAGDEDGARGVEDPAGQPLRLAGARAAEHDRHVLDRRPHAQQPDPAQPHRDLDRRQPPPPPPRQLAPGDGRTTPARRFTAGPDATRATSRVEATPALRRDRAPQRVTVADVRDHRFHPTTATSTRDRPPGPATAAPSPA